MTEIDGAVTIDATELVYGLAGSGDPVVFLHAGVADRRMWSPQVAVFAEHFQTLRYDMRGFGDSKMVGEPFAHRSDLAVLMDSLGLDRVDLVSCSMGGAVALEFVVEHPDRVRSLILVGSGVPGVVPEGGYYDPPQYEEAVAAFKAGSLDRAAELDVEIWVGGHGRDVDAVDDGIRTLVFDMDRRALESETLRSEYEERLDPKVGSRLAEIRCPTLVLVGAFDMPDVVGLARHLGDAIDGAELTVIPDAAHLPNLERPDEFNRLVMEFFRGL